jgi:hypothetical protein
MLNGQPVAVIHADLTAIDGISINTAQRLAENGGVSFMGVTKSGPFDISEEIAFSLLHSPSPHGKPNSEVVLPSINGADLAKRPSGEWIINFGIKSETEAALYEAPFEYALKYINRLLKNDLTPSAMGPAIGIFSGPVGPMPAEIRLLAGYTPRFQGVTRRWADCRRTTA